MLEYIPLLATCSAATWWWSKWSEVRAQSESGNRCRLLMEVVLKGGGESLIFGFFTWISWIFVIFQIHSVDAQHPPNIISGLILSTAHVIVAMLIGWFYVYEPDWSRNHENRKSSALFCGFTMTYMLTDLYMMYCTVPPSLTLWLHHFLSIFGTFCALNLTHQTFIANCTIIYETTGLAYNLHQLLEHLNVARTHWLFLINGFTFVGLFTYFRIYLGSAICINFLSEDKIESLLFRLLLVLFQSINVYWYYIIIYNMLKILL